MNSYSSFQGMVAGTEQNIGDTMDVFSAVAIENAPLDLSSNPNGTVTHGAVKPVSSVQESDNREVIPEWGQTLSGRVDRLENEMRQVNGKVDEILRRLPQPQ
jgi:hypothetical protein